MPDSIVKAGAGIRTARDHLLNHRLCIVGEIVCRYADDDADGTFIPAAAPQMRQENPLISAVAAAVKTRYIADVI